MLHFARRVTVAEYDFADPSSSNKSFRSLFWSFDFCSGKGSTISERQKDSFIWNCLWCKRWLAHGIWETDMHFEHNSSSEKLFSVTNSAFPSVKKVFMRHTILNLTIRPLSNNGIVVWMMTVDPFSVFDRGSDHVCRNTACSNFSPLVNSLST